MPLNGGGCFNLCVHCAAGEAESEPVRALPSKSKPDGERLLVHSVARKRALTPAGLLGRARAGAAARASATRRSSPRTPPVEASARKEAAQRHARARGRSSIEGRPLGGEPGGGPCSHWRGKRGSGRPTRPSSDCLPLLFCTAIPHCNARSGRLLTAARARPRPPRHPLLRQNLNLVALRATGQGRRRLLGQGGGGKGGKRRRPALPPLGDLGIPALRPRSTRESG